MNEIEVRGFTAPLCRGTWECPECGETVEVFYEDLADIGTPICGVCDCEMDLGTVECRGHSFLLAAARAAVEAVNELIAEDDPFDMPPPWLDDLDQAIAAAEQGEKEEEQ